MTPKTSAAGASPLLELQGLALASAADARLVEGVGLTVDRGETVALVGESGSGKSLTALAILGLLPPGIVRRSGSVLYHGTDVTGLAGRHAALRGRRIAAIFQDPLAALDPRWTVGRYLASQFRRLSDLSGAAVDRAVAASLRRVGLGDVARVAASYPHELSGGMAQRVMIAGALAGGPDLLVADEPTTALDVTTQAQILDLLEDIQAETGLGILMITHDLGVVAEMARRMVVLYGGRVMEAGPAAQLLTAPRHPYTQALLASMPDMARPEPPQPISGAPGDRPEQPGACPFQPRCRFSVSPACFGTAPALRTHNDIVVACHNPLVPASRPGPQPPALPRHLAEQADALA